MASGGTGGFGRGGRGAALLQALAQIKSNPGQVDGGDLTAASSTADAVRRGLQPGLPLGRGMVLGSTRQTVMRQQDKSPKEERTSLGAGDAEGHLSAVKPLGRGLAAMQALIAQKQQQTSSMGRGFGLLFKQPVASRHHEKPETRQEPPTAEMANLKVGERQGPKERVRLPTVTKIGTEGTPVSLSANYVRIICKHVGVYLYHVSFSPMVDNKKLRMKLLAEHKDKFKTLGSFDGSTLYLPFKLPDEETVVTSTRKTDGSVIHIKVTFVKVVPSEQCSHLYNVIFRRVMYILEMCQVGHYFYNPHTPATVPQHKLEVWPGYVTAIHEYEGGLMLLLDASHRVLRTETVYDLMEKAASINPRGYQEEITKKVVGTVVLTRYNNRTYRVDDIMWAKTPQDHFQCRAGESMSFEEYYKQQHNIVIKDRSQPLLLNKRKPPRGAPSGQKHEPEFFCLVPELCYVTGLTDDLRQQFTVMKDLAVHTRVTPAQRQLAMRKFIHSVNSNAEARAELAVWGLELDRSTVIIAGRQLPPERIIMKNKEFPSGPQADWSREATRNELISPVNLVNWGIFYTRWDAGKANDFIKQLQSESRNMGISCQAPFRRELVNDRTETLVQELRNSINERVQLVVVINPTNRDDRYSAIKKVCCVETPVPSQVIIARTISKPDKLRSVVQKIALQINCKLGGELWAVRIPLQKLMVVGIDTYHDSSKVRQSIGGFVASINRDCTRWYSNVCFHRPGQEFVHGLQICLTNALKKYHSVNHFLPEKIVIYRDGVGDGQLDILADHEVKQLQRCFSSFGEYTPQCTTVCVQKRINTRIYGCDKDGGMINPPPGTVVDHTVTRRERYDFFIVSQHVRQGTVSPTHYIVVEDGLDLKPGLMQRLTYKMTHLYYNWPGTVRVPAPCQYAHKLAYLVGESIHKEPAESLSDRLFFL